jgi:hypothetical protein
VLSVHREYDDRQMDILQAHGRHVPDDPHNDFKCPQKDEQGARGPFKSTTDQDRFNVCDTLLSIDGKVPVTLTGNTIR